MAMTLRLTDSQAALLQELATAQGVSKHEAVVRLIEGAHQRHVSRRDDLLERIVKEDADLLGLLAR